MAVTVIAGCRRAVPIGSWRRRCRVVAPIAAGRSGRCKGCKRRVQGRHPEQTSEALGAAASGVGPHLKAWAMWLHYEMGLSFARSARVLSIWA